MPADESQRTAPTEAESTGCTIPHPHLDVPCARGVVPGTSRCSVCGNLHDSPECAAAGCWEPMTVADLLVDNLITGTDTWTLNEGEADV